MANAEPGEFASFNRWQEVSAFMDSMVSAHGFNRTELESIFSKVQHVDRAIQLMKPAPPGKPKNWRAYRARFIDPVRIDAGVAFWNEHADALARAEAQYGVPAEIIVGIIGVETVYGRNTGNFRVMDAITTLAFDYPDTPTRDARMTFFRGELESTLIFARDNGIDPFSLLGSYASIRPPPSRPSGSNAICKACCRVAHSAASCHSTPDPAVCWASSKACSSIGTQSPTAGTSG